MMEKLYRNSTQLELLREFLNLQKDMIVLMLSMLEGKESDQVYGIVYSLPEKETLMLVSSLIMRTTTKNML